MFEYSSFDHFFKIYFVGFVVHFRYALVGLRLTWVDQTLTGLQMKVSEPFTCYAKQLRTCLPLLLRIHSGHLEILGFPMGGAY